ncbi:Hsp70 family protein [Paludibacter jiangxiensis]|uniref:Hypothetical chaperone protein n=1 Tax=Paludibacter jiangxiensis TaxID=681398 RepID=A0A170YKZ8_9BACT|nr:Hsp70 family protein [Paludibacter jiangxiensis]GAT61888.1 hypothetical chaperone protein [Paludibacter jiangxiensis]
MALNKLNCGLDFGTSNTAIALTDRNTQKNVLLEHDSSVLFFDDTNDLSYAVGKEAVDKYIASQMKGRLLKSVKTLLKQKKFTHTYIFGKKFTPDELVTLIISHFKEQAEKAIGSTIDEVTLGRPVIFSDDPEKERTAVRRLLNAAANAGFKEVKLLFEPIAAAFTYESTLNRSERVLVADIGGGTSDFTIMNLGPDRINATDRKDDIIANSGVYVGGDSFDAQLMWHKLTPLLGRGVTYKTYDNELEIPISIFRELNRWERSFLLKDTKMRRDLNGYYVFSGKNSKLSDLMTLIDNNLVYALYKQIEKSKIDLSEQTETSLRFQMQSIDINALINRADFSMFIREEIRSIEECVLNMLDKVNMKPSDIDTVFLTGGSASVVSVRSLFESLFGAEKINTGDHFKSIAYGLSLS